MGPGFFPLSFRNECGGVFSSCGCSSVLSKFLFVVSSSVTIQSISFLINRAASNEHAMAKCVYGFLSPWVSHGCYAIWEV